MKLYVKTDYRNRSTVYTAGQVIEVTDEEAAALMVDSPESFAPADEAVVEDEDDRFHLDGLNEAQHEALYDAGFLTVEDLANASDDDLQAVDGIGAKSVEVIREAVDSE